MFEATLKGTSDILFVVRKRGNANHPTAVSGTYIKKKINPARKIEKKGLCMKEK